MAADGDLERRPSTRSNPGALVAEEGVLAVTGAAGEYNLAVGRMDFCSCRLNALKTLVRISSGSQSAPHVMFELLLTEGIYLSSLDRFGNSSASLSDFTRLFGTKLLEGTVCTPTELR